MYFCAVLWHILCLPVAHKFKSLFVPCCGTFCAFPWHILCLPVAHCILFPLVKNCKSRIASQELQVKNCKSRIASQELRVKNCKSRIASQELQVKNCKSRIAKKSILDSLDIFSRGLMNEIIFSLVFKFVGIFAGKKQLQAIGSSRG
jgi:hypothetical protein